MQEVILKREFRYNGIKLVDPNPALSPDTVRKFYAPQYMELTNAVVEGPTTKGDVLTYTFLRAAGAKGRAAGVKGRAAGSASIRSKLLAIARSDLGGSAVKYAEHSPEQKESCALACEALMNVSLSHRGGRSMPLPSTAFGLWG